MSRHDWLNSDEANAANWQAARGAFLGAVKWGSAAVILGTIGYLRSPVYRGTTVQFKV